MKITATAAMKNKTPMIEGIGFLSDPRAINAAIPAMISESITKSTALLMVPSCCQVARSH
eukprot:CAMPEP_0195270932 /NCGR_PEP_ID=MMETSP0706-20130129/14691_1 /TAXON_ID=33640 /ORGANISM="Asterionellopsis glacialis, Strain CCMP134" /LENGTH=59 /DNA_ID=CAMNT_0040326391 /DNA_START=149 /DNA_END=328 /DNA_ORIENTATION=-